MKNKIKLITILFIGITLPLISQSQDASSFPKVENYKHGEMDIMAIPFGLGNKIQVGKILNDGTVQFAWPEVDLNSINNSSVFMASIQSVLVGMSYCEDGQIEENTENCKVANTQFLYLYKKGKQAGVLFPATSKEMLANEPANIYSKLATGSYLTWFYSAGDGAFKANCSEKMEWEGKYNFISEHMYDVHLKKGWNIVEYQLAEIENWKDENGPGSMEKKVIRTSLDQIPDDIKWYIKMF